MIWAAVVVGAAACYATKLTGALIPQRTLEHPTLQRIVGLLPVAMLAALVAVQTFADDSALVIDARLAGLLAAITALLLRAPFLVVVLVAAAVAAGLRATGLAT